MKRIASVLLALALAGAGCVQHSTTRDRRGSLASLAGRDRENADFGVVVNVYGDGRLELHGHPVTRKELVERLLEDADGATGGRMTVLRGRAGATRVQLEDLKRHLLEHHIYRVTVAFPHEPTSRGTPYKQILPDNRLEATDLSPDDPLVHRLFDGE